MTSDERNRRWDEIRRELSDIQYCKVMPIDPCLREDELLLEREEIEYEVGQEYFRQREQRGE